MDDFRKVDQFGWFRIVKHTYVACFHGLNLTRFDLISVYAHACSVHLTSNAAGCRSAAECCWEASKGRRNKLVLQVLPSSTSWQARKRQDSAKACQGLRGLLPLSQAIPLALIFFCHENDDMSWYFSLVMVLSFPILSLHKSGPCYKSCPVVHGDQKNSKYLGQNQAQDRELQVLCSC